MAQRHRLPRQVSAQRGQQPLGQGLGRGQGRANARSLKVVIGQVLGLRAHGGDQAADGSRRRIGRLQQTHDRNLQRGGLAVGVGDQPVHAMQDAGHQHQQPRRAAHRLAALRAVALQPVGQRDQIGELGLGRGERGQQARAGHADIVLVVAPSHRLQGKAAPLLDGQAHGAAVALRALGPGLAPGRVADGARQVHRHGRQPAIDLAHGGAGRRIRMDAPEGQAEQRSPQAAGQAQPGEGQQLDRIGHRPGDGDHRGDHQKIAEHGRLGPIDPQEAAGEGHHQQGGGSGPDAEGGDGRRADRHAGPRHGEDGQHPRTHPGRTAGIHQTGPEGHDRRPGQVAVVAQHGYCRQGRASRRRAQTLAQIGGLGREIDRPARERVRSWAVERSSSGAAHLPFRRARRQARHLRGLGCFARSGDGQAPFLREQ